MNDARPNETIAGWLGVATDEEVERHSLSVEPDDLGLEIVALKGIIHRARLLEGWLEDRYQRERENTFYTAPNGRRWFMRSERHHEVSDPRGLTEALLQLPLAPLDIALAAGAINHKQGWEVDHNVLNRLATHNREAALVIREFRSWRYGPAHLVCAEEEK
jgi:hypothetical protein